MMKILADKRREAEELSKKSDRINTLINTLNADDTLDKLQDDYAKTKARLEEIEQERTRLHAQAKRQKCAIKNMNDLVSEISAYQQSTTRIQVVVDPLKVLYESIQECQICNNPKYMADFALLTNCTHTMCVSCVSRIKDCAFCRMSTKTYLRLVKTGERYGMTTVDNTPVLYVQD